MVSLVIYVDERLAQLGESLEEVGPVEVIEPLYSIPCLIVWNKAENQKTYAFFYMNCDYTLDLCVDTFASLKQHYPGAEISLLGPSLPVELLFIDKVDLLHTQSLKELPDLIKHLVRVNPESEVLMLKKQPTLFQSNELWLKFLMSVPGVSRSKAEAIAKVYKTLDQLLKTCHKDLANLANLAVGKKRLGNALASTIFNCLTNPNPDAPIR